MSALHCRYKVFGGLSLLVFLNCDWGAVLYMVAFHSKISIDRLSTIPFGEYFPTYAAIGGIQILFLTLLATQCRYVIIDDAGITYINPLLPFLRRRTAWSDFDHYILVDEKSKYTTYEAVWLIREGKAQSRFSSFYFSNYEELKSRVVVPGHGKKHLSPIRQLLAMFGWVRIKNDD